jgi:hypothetical protein
MISYLQLALGLSLAYLGFVHISNNPLAGSCELLVSGLLILTGVEGLIRPGRRAK